VVGRLLPKAKARITRAHCRVGKITRVRAGKKHRNRVIAQRPARGKLKNGARINLTVGRRR